MASARTTLFILCSMGLPSLGLVACGGGNAPPPRAAAPSDGAPQWVDRIPDSKGKICAVGTAEPSFYREDGKIYAADNARSQLASTLSTRVQSVMVDIQTSSGQDVDASYVNQTQTFATDAVVAGAQVVSYWYDDNGTRGRVHATYALACIDLNATVADLNSRLQQQFPENKEKNQQIRDRAKAAFDSLDAEENKHQAKK